MLWRGPYPAALKHLCRVTGHLNNEQALGMLEAVGDGLPGTVIAGHISEQNNSLGAVTSLLSPLIQRTKWNVIYATQSQGFNWVSLTRQMASLRLLESVSASIAISPR